MSRSSWAPGIWVCLSLFVLAHAQAEDRPRKFDEIGFLQEAAAAGMKEVKAGQIAKASAYDAKVRQFAERMIKDHSEANKELQRIAKAMDVSLPAFLPREHKEVCDRLEKLRGRDFDPAYMQAMVKGHEKAVERFTTAAKESRNDKLRAFAAKTLPTLKEHLEMAKTINARLGSR